MRVLLLIDVDAERSAELAVLADEMTEDPRCWLVIRGLDDPSGDRAVLLSSWEPNVAEEVQAGLVVAGWPVRRLTEA